VSPRFISCRAGDRIQRSGLNSNKDVLVFERPAGRKVFLVTVDLKNELGAVSDISDRSAKLKLNILTGFTSTPGTDNIGRFSYLAEARDPSLTAAAPKTELESSKYLVSCSVKEPHNNLLVDSLNFPLRWNNGDRAVMLRTEFFSAMATKIRTVLGTGADVTLYELGYDHGFPSWKNIVEDYETTTLDDLEELMSFYTAVGWGRTQAIAFDPAAKTTTVRMFDNFECAYSSSAAPTSHFVRGHLAGAFSAIFKSPMKVEETHCIATGDEYCEFEAQPS
jgi:predicted hydrocarbon binding protein